MGLLDAHGAAARAAASRLVRAFNPFALFLVLIGWGALGFAGVEEAAAVVGFVLFLLLMTLGTVMRTRVDARKLRDRQRAEGEQADDGEPGAVARAGGAVLTVVAIVRGLRKRA